MIEICLTLLDNQHLSKYRPLLKSRPKGSTGIETYELHKMISVLILHIGSREIMKWTNRHGLEQESRNFLKYWAHKLVQKSYSHRNLSIWLTCPNSQFPADLITFTEENLNGKLHFLCCGRRAHIYFESPKIIVRQLSK